MDHPHPHLIFNSEDKEEKGTHTIFRCNILQPTKSGNKAHMRSIQALVIAQARARAQRARMVSEDQNLSPYRITTEENFFMLMQNVSSIINSCQLTTFQIVE